MAHSEKILQDVRSLVIQGQLERAGLMCRQLLQRDAHDVEALFQLGSIHLLQKNYREGSRLLKQALSLNPCHIDALNNLGAFYLEHDRDFKAAENCFRKVVEINPKHVNALLNLANVCLAEYRLDDAERYYRLALGIAPDNGNILNNLGALCVRRGCRRDAIGYYRQALSVLGEDTEVMANLIVSEMAAGSKDEALKLFHYISRMENPQNALFPAFGFSRMACLWEDSAAIIPRLLNYIRNGHTDLGAFENINLTLLATPEIDKETLFEIHRATGKVIEDLRVGEPFTRHDKAMMVTDRLRVGYISPDFRNHAVNSFFRGLVNHHDRDLFEVYCYSSSHVVDAITEQYRAAADVFVNVASMSDRQLADRIHCDGIQLLVDLAGYTQNGRIPVLSYSPAPVQIMYLGYPYTSGLASVDYFISDPYLDGPLNAQYFSEQQLHLPASFISFESMHDQEIHPVAAFDRNGFVTFGSLNNTYKLNPRVISVWSQVLKQVPNSRMIINHPNCDLEATRTHIRAEFSRHGIEENRVEIIWQKHPSGSHLKYYNDIDIVLDSFPLTGGTTTIEAVWMGVPVVTLVGAIYPYRLSYSVLKNVGSNLDDLIAFSESEFVDKAISLANNPARLRELHASIPDNLKASILCDPVLLTRHMEAAYIDAWNRKFPGAPMGLELSAPDQFVQVRDGSRIAVKGGLDDLETYVLHEQQGWFEDEYGFVLGSARPGERVVDIGAGKGIYALPLARKIGPEGELWAATLTPRDARYLTAGVERNGLENLHPLVGGGRKLLIDMEMKRHNLKDIDFVRLQLDVSAKDTVLSGRSFFEINSPLVMFGIKQNNQSIDSAFAEIFRKWGYDIYRLVPGLKLLAPFALNEDPDVFAMNLFACRPDRAEQIADRGMLVKEAPPLKDLPGIHDRSWQDYLKSLPCAANQVQYWSDSIRQHDEWETYWTVLNLFSMTKDMKRAPELRYSAMRTAYGILLLLVQNRATLPRCLTFLRVLVELGKRGAAVNLLNDLVGFLDSGADITINEPLLAVSDEYASMDPASRVGEWLVASILEQREKLRAFSTFFTGQESLSVLNAIKESGFCTPEAEHRLTLIQKRSPLAWNPKPEG